MKLLPSKRCNPWILVLTSLFGPGLGQIITGRVQFGMILILANYMIPLFFLHGGYVWSLFGIASFTMLQVGLYLFSVCEAIIYGLRNEECQRPSFKTLIPFIIIVRFTVRLIIWTAPFTTFVVPSRSMVPTLLVGDRFSSNRHYYRTHQPKRNEIVIIRVPGWKNKLIKRVVALGGDVIELRQDSLFINGIHQRESVPIYKQPGVYKNIPPTRVPYGHVYVLGDNRNNSNDSRYYGAVPVSLLAGKPVLIFFSHNIDRIGTKIK